METEGKNPGWSGVRYACEQAQLPDAYNQVFSRRRVKYQKVCTRTVYQPLDDEIALLFASLMRPLR